MIENDEYPLIGRGEPAPITVLNEHGSASVLLTGDHVSNLIPRALNSLGVDPEVLEQHVAYDIGTRKLLTHLAEHLDAPAVIAGYSRLVVDLNRSLEDPSAFPEVSDGIPIPGNRDLSRKDRANRSLEDPSAFPEVSDGIPIPGNRDLSRKDRAARVHSFYTPYRAAIDQALRRFRGRGITPAFISIHSFTPQMAGNKRPWHIGLLWDKDPRIPVPLLERLRAHPDGFNVGDNEPYSGKHPADYTIDHHAEAAGLPHVSVEIRQDLVNTEQGAERWATVLDESLRGILSDPELYRIWEK